MEWGKVPQDMFNQICNQMESMEDTGAFDQMFKNIITTAKGTNQTEFLKSIRPEMRLFKSFFLKIYGYDLNHPGFAENALTRLEILGCGKARNYYTGVLTEWQHEHDKSMNNVAAWYRKQCESEFERKEVRKSRKQQEVELLEKKKKLLLMKKLQKSIDK